MASQDPNRRPEESVTTTVTAVHAIQSAHPEVPGREDIVFDFDGRQIADLSGLSMILTAQQIAGDRSAVVWLRDAPMRTWALLRALGVDHLFSSFPESTSQPS
jgi:hypothetical protein